MTDRNDGGVAIHLFPKDEEQLERESLKTKAQQQKRREERDGSKHEAV